MQEEHNYKSLKAKYLRKKL